MHFLFKTCTSLLRVLFKSLHFILIRNTKTGFKYLHNFSDLSRQMQALSPGFRACMSMRARQCWFQKLPGAQHREPPRSARQPQQRPGEGGLEGEGGGWRARNVRQAPRRVEGGGVGGGQQGTGVGAGDQWHGAARPGKQGPAAAKQKKLKKVN